MTRRISPHLDAGALGFHIVQEKLPHIHTDRPRELDFAARPAVETLEGGARVYCYAPNAERVEILLMNESDRRPMTRARDEGYFCAAFQNMPGGLYLYDVFINGVQTIDPRGQIIFSSRAYNYFEVTEACCDDYHMKDVPHGAVQTRYFYAEESRSMRSVMIYTPPDYEKSAERYPVLYLQHGGGENEGGWIWSGRAHMILDNLISRGECRPMLLVMNDCNVLTERDGLQHTGSIARVVGDSCVPFIDETFRTLPDRRCRAAAGLSQGGLSTRQIVFENPELFSQMGVFSSGAGFEPDSVDIWGRRHDYSRFFTSAQAYAEQFPVTFITCGADDPRHTYLEPQAMSLMRQGYPIQYREYPGGHEWQVWRKSLIDFLPMLFAE